MYIGFVSYTRTGLPQDLSEISFLAQSSPKNRLCRSVQYVSTLHALSN